MAYTSGTTADQLAAVRSAIANCLDAQQYNIGSRSKRMANLSDLFKRERELEAQLSRESDGIFAVAQVDRPTL